MQTKAINLDEFVQFPLYELNTWSEGNKGDLGWDVT